MKPMVVTLEVSKLSGWLNADATCRGSKRHAVRGEVYGLGGGRRRATAVQAACRRGRDCGLGAGHGEERAHVEHGAHVRDTGGVEAQRLVERRCLLSRVERRAYGVRRGLRVDRRDVAGGRGASSV